MAAMIAACPLQAEDAEPEQGEGFSLMEKGARLFFDGMMREMDPALKDLRGFAEEFGPQLQSFVEEMGPAFVDLMDQVGDLSQYHKPEILPNGDIIMRKKTPGELAIEPGEEIDI